MKRKILRKTRIVTILSALVVFLTVYSLVLPAVALTDDKAGEDPGISTSETTDVAEAEKLSLNEETSGDVEIEPTEQVEEDAQKEEIKEEKKVVENVSYPAVSFSDSLGDMIVYVEAPEGAFPENTQMQLKEVEDEAALVDSINSNLENKEVKAIKAVDITFTYNNEEFEPLKPIKVSMTSSFIESNKEDEQLLVHVDNDNNTNIVETTEVKEKDVEVINNVEEVQTLVENTDEINEITTDNTVAFESDAFSVYVLVYTVDFEYSVNGRIYQFSLMGGKKINLSDLVEVLGIIGDTNNGEKAVFDSVDSFLKEVANVEFSDESLVKVTPVAGDWELESLQPFMTDESLTITMTDGTKYVVQVTDAVSEDNALDALNNNGYIDLTNDENTLFLHVSAESSVTENEQERDAAFKLTFTYSLEENVVKAIDQYNQPFSLKYDLSSTIGSSPLEIRNISNGVISIGSRRLGTYTIVNGVVTLNFTDPSYFDGRTSFTGYFNLTAETNETELGSNDEWTYEFPGTGDTIPIHYKKTVEDGSKSVNSTKNADGSYTLHYTANINVNSDLDSMTFNDTLSGLQTLEASSVKINGTSVSISQTGDGFTFDVASALGTTGVAKGSYQVTYDTKVTAAQLEAMTADKTIEENTASWKVNGNKDVPGGETTVEINKPVPPIPVEKTSSSSGANQPGDTITYNVSYGDANTALADFHISDSITDVVIPQGTDVTLNYGNGQTVTVPFNSQATDSSYGKGTVTLFDYTFPAGTEGNGPVTVTYSVKLIDADTAKENGVFDSTSVVNTAIEHRQNTSDTETTTVTYEKEPSYTVEKTASANPTDEDGHWLPGSTITYTLTIGDADTNMAGVNIKDVMTDLQVLQGDIMIQVGNGSQMRLSNYVSDAIKWTDDGQYSANDVELFNFNMPSNAGNGPVVITYTTKVISQEQATANGIYGDVTIKNTGYGGKQSDGTNGTGSFNPYPIEKTVTKSNADVEGQIVEMGDTVHYTLTFGDSTMNIGGVTILDEMTDLQKLVSDVTIRKPDGTTVTMPMGSGQWSDNGVVWNYFDDGKYSTQMVRVFCYKLPSDFGNGPITVEYDTQIISEDEANESGIKDTKDAYNIFTVNNHQAQTDVKIEFPTDPNHEPQISKKFDKWDIDNNKVYWTITVEKTADSAYPLENIKVSEGSYGGITITESKVAGWNNHGISEDEYKLFDVVNAVVTTDDGTVLTPGVDYTIDKDEASFTFPILNEKVHINFAFISPIKIIDGFKMHNKAHVTWVNDWTRKVAEADAEYNKPGITIVKNGAYTEDDRLIKWEVSLNPSKNAFVDSDPIRVWFEDQLPSGMTLVNYSTKTEDNPSISVYYKGNWWYDPFEVYVSVDENNAISQTDIAAHTQDNGEHGLDGNNIVVTYFTKLSDVEWDRITSSASGSETFENKVTVTAGNGEKFSDSDDVTVTTDGYLKKYDTTHDQGGIVIDPDTNANSKNITYAVEVNPNGYVLNSHDPLSLTDYISTNMDLDTASVQIYNAHKGADGRLVADSTVPAGLQVSYNDDSRLLSIQNIPDETPLLLTYTCVARAQGEDTFRNTATLIGGGSHSSSTSEKHTIQTNDAGAKIDGIMLSIHKIDENNISQNLSGAKFQLYECQLVIGELTNPETYSQSWWEDLLAKVDRMTAGTATQDEIDYVKENFKITDYVPVGGAVETGSTGYTQWTSLNEHKLYAWVETEAPEGYSGYAPDDYHYFVGYQHIDVNYDVLPQPLLSPEEQLARKHAAWALDDACQFANDIRVASMSNLTTWTATNVESHYTSITVGKMWEGDSDNLFETRPTDGIQLQLWVIKADGTRETVGEPVSINVNEDTGEWPTYIWNRLPSEDDDGNTLKYTVTEKRVENYSTTYSDNGEGQSSGTITVTNRMIPKSTDIYVEKVFAEGTEKPASIKVTLYVIKTDKNDVVSDPEVTSYEAILSETNSWKWHWDRLPTTQVIDGKAYYLSYTVMEDTAALERQGFCYTVSYSDNGEGVIETTENEPLVITNTKETGKITVKKTFFGVTDETDLSALQNGLTVTVRGKDAGGKGVDILTLTWNDVKDGGYEITHLPINEVYTVTEDISAHSVLPKYTVTSETVSSAKVTATVDGETAELKNVYEEAPQTGSLKITKNVTVSEGADISKADGTYTFEIWKQIHSDEGVNEIQVTKKADGTTDIGELKITVTNGAASPAEIIVDGLEAGTYIVKETASSNTAMMPDTSVTGYDSGLGGIVVTVSAGDTAGVRTAAFTNKYETTEATVKKVWSDSGSSKRPTSLTVTLVENGEPTTKTVTLSSSNSWEDTISNLPKYKNGQEIEYTWLEGDMPDGYFLTSVASEGTVTTLTNTLSTYDLKTSYTGIKSWSDEGNKYSTRPTDLTVTLYADGTATSLTPVWAKDEATNQWTYTFENLPVFSESGSIIKYTAEETVPAGYTQTKSQTETTGSFGTITYENGMSRITPDNKINWTLGSLIDLSFVAIKPTANGDVVVWTHRVPVPSEKTAIINLIRNNALPGCSNRNVVFYSGTGSSVYTPHGNIKVDYDQENLSVSIDFGDTSVWSQFIVGQFNQSNSSSYNIGTTAFTNTLETTTLSGSKTWVIDGTTVPENPILTLTRTVTTTTGEGEDAVTTTSTPETVKVKDGETEVNLQPTWSGTGKERTFEYTGLPAKDKDGNTYTYSVAEYQFTVGDVTYTVTKDAYGAYVATPDAEHTETAAHFQVNQTGNAITNTKVTDFEFSKIWKDISSNPVEWPTGATITVTLNAYTNSSTQEAVLEDQTLTFSPTSLPNGWTVVTSTDGKKTTYKVNDLPAVTAAGDTLTYYVVETQVTGYKEPSYSDKDGHGLINVGKATNGQQIINAPEDGVELPSTGGPGNEMIKLLGATIMLASIAVFLKKKRK